MATSFPNTTVYLNTSLNTSPGYWNNEWQYNTVTLTTDAVGAQAAPIEGGSVFVGYFDERAALREEIRQELLREFRMAPVQATGPRRIRLRD